MQASLTVERLFDDYACVRYVCHGIGVAVVGIDFDLGTLPPSSREPLHKCINAGGLVEEAQKREHSRTRRDDAWQDYIR